MSTLDATADRGRPSPLRPPTLARGPVVQLPRLHRVAVPIQPRAPIPVEFSSSTHQSDRPGGSTTRSLGSEKRSASFSLFPLCVSFHTLHSSRFPKIFLPKHSDRSSSSAPPTKILCARCAKGRPRQRIKLSLFTAP